MMQDLKLNLNKTLWEKAMAKMEEEFKKEKIPNTDFILIIILLGLYKRVDLSDADYIYLATENTDERKETNYINKTIAIHKKLLKKITSNGKSDGRSYSEVVNILMAAYIVTPLNKYTDCIKPLYTIIGSKNETMQKETASAVKLMQLESRDMTLVDACCATGALFFGLRTYDWKRVILNDLNPLRTNFLNILKSEPLKLIKLILNSDLSFIDKPDTKNLKLREFKNNLDKYQNKRKNYCKVDKSIDIAYQMFLTQCIDKYYIENEDKIFNRILRFLPAHLKLIYTDTVITQMDCLEYLENNRTIELSGNSHITIDSNRLLLLDPPYISTEAQCAIKGYDYNKFHSVTADFLEKADYPFLYYCRSSAPKSDKTFSRKDAEHIMKQKLGDCFYNRNFYFLKKKLDEDTTELMISNQNYTPDQFQWTDVQQDIL